MLAKTYKKRIIKNMENVGTYRPEFSQTINELAIMLEDIDKARETFEQGGARIVVKHTNKNGNTNIVKNPLYLAIEGLRTQILNYSKELGLTPAGLKKIKGDAVEADAQNEFMEALKEFGA